MLIHTFPRHYLKTVNSQSPDICSLFVSSDLEACEPGWEKFQGFCYRHFTKRQSWEVAEQHCRMCGGHLLSVMTPEEQDYINGKAPGEQHSLTSLNLIGWMSFLSLLANKNVDVLVLIFRIYCQTRFFCLLLAEAYFLQQKFRLVIFHLRHYSNVGIQQGGLPKISGQDTTTNFDVNPLTDFFSLENVMVLTLVLVFCLAMRR